MSRGLFIIFIIKAGSERARRRAEREALRRAAERLAREEQRERARRGREVAEQRGDDVHRRRDAQPALERDGARLDVPRHGREDDRVERHEDHRETGAAAHGEGEAAEDACRAKLSGRGALDVGDGEAEGLELHLDGLARHALEEEVEGAEAVEKGVEAVRAEQPRQQQLKRLALLV